MIDTSSDSALRQFQRWLDGFVQLCNSPSREQFDVLFAGDCYWKDILSFTGGYRTYSGPAAVYDAFTAAIAATPISQIRVAKSRLAPRHVRRSAKNIIEAYFDFDTLAGHGTGFVRLLVTEDSDTSPAWLMLTTLQSIHGHEERIGERRPTGVEWSQSFAGENWLEQRQSQMRYDDRDPEVLIVGGGQGGLTLAARLRQMGVDALIVEKHPAVGDNWRTRYHSLTLHNEVWANCLPYMPFPETWPTFVPKDKLAGYLEAYAEAMELNVWTSTEMKHAEYDAKEGVWTADLISATDGTRRIRARHLVMAVGGSTGVPNNKLTLPGIEQFAGEIVHSSEFRGGVAYRDRHAIVIGAGTSGHDVAQDLYENGAASVSLVQRGPTCVVSLVPSGTMVYGLYREGPPDDMDLITAAIPYEVLRETYQWITKRTCEIDADLLNGLRSVGFKLDFGHDDTGFHMMYLRKGGGYYINVGCSELIADRKVKLIQAEQIDSVVTEGIRLTDGTTLPADLIVNATGYRNLQNALAELLGTEVADRVGPVWGFDENYAMRNMWQRTAQDNLWIMGGTLIDARLYSRFLAVQIVADLRGVELPAVPDSAVV